MTGVCGTGSRYTAAPAMAARTEVTSWDAATLTEGSVIREGSRIRVSAQLIRGASDEHLWSETYDRELRDVLDLESQVAQAIARRVEVTVTGKERARLVAIIAACPGKPQMALDAFRVRPGA